MVTFLIVMIYIAVSLRVLSLIFTPTQIGKPRAPLDQSSVAASTIGNLIGIAVMILVLVQLTGING